MPRKRTDQWTGEAGATDHKTRPLGPNDAVSDDREFSEAMEGRFSRSQPIPPKVLDPETEQAREKELARQRRKAKRKRH